MQLRVSGRMLRHVVAATLAAVLIPSVAVIGVVTLTFREPIAFGPAAPAVALPPAAGGLMTVTFPASPGGTSGVSIRGRYRLTAGSTALAITNVLGNLPGQRVTIKIKRRKFIIGIQTDGPNGGSPYTFTFAAV